MPKRANLFPRSLQRVAHRVQLVRRCWWKISLLGGHRVAGRANDKRAAVFADNSTFWLATHTTLFATSLRRRQFGNLKFRPPAVVAHSSASTTWRHGDDHAQSGFPVGLVGTVARMASLLMLKDAVTAEAAIRASHDLPQTTTSELGMLTGGNTFGPVGRTNGTSSVQIR